MANIRAGIRTRMRGIALMTDPTPEIPLSFRHEGRGRIVERSAETRGRFQQSKAKVDRGLCNLG